MEGLSADPESFEKPIVVVIGSTGTGKSSLCNILCGIDPFDPDAAFHVSATVDACTFKTEAYSCSWLGSGEKFTIIDTPGMDDPEGRDTEHIAEMVEKLKQIKFVNAFVIVFNGQNPRVDRSLSAMLKIFQGIFGAGFWQNTIIEFSRWCFSGREKKQRERSGRSEEAQHADWNRKFRSDFGLDHEVPTVFIDACYDVGNDSEKEAFGQETAKLHEIINSLPEYECKDFEAVLAEMDQLMADKDKAERERDEEEENRKKAEKIADDEKRRRSAADMKAAKAADQAVKAKADKIAADLKAMNAQREAEKQRAARQKAEDEAKKERDRLDAARREQERLANEARELAQFHQRKTEWERSFTNAKGDNREQADWMNGLYPDLNCSKYIGVYNPCHGWEHHGVTHMGDSDGMTGYRWRTTGHNYVWGRSSTRSPPSDWRGQFEDIVNTFDTGGSGKDVMERIESALDSKGIRWKLIHVVKWGNGLRACCSGSNCFFKNREGCWSVAVLVNP